MEKAEFQYRPSVQIAAALLLGGALWVVSPAIAEGIYKSVDVEGHVTYSSVPPDEAVESQPVSLPDAPTEAQRQEAVQREMELQKAADSLARERSARDNQRAETVKDTERALKEAKAQLDEAKVMQDADWQVMAGGGRHLKESYFERVRDAEEKLRQAEEAASKARHDVR